MRDIRLFLFAIALPAVLVAAGGVRLLSVEAERARGAAKESLHLRTAALAVDVERTAAEKAQLALAPLASAADAATRRAEARRIAEENPDIAEVRLFPRDGRGEEGSRRGREGRGGDGLRRERGAGPSREGRGGPFPREGSGGPFGFFRFFRGADTSLVIDTRLPSGEPCRVRFTREAAEAILAAVAESGDDIGPVFLTLSTISGHPIASQGEAVENAADVATVPVPRTNARLRAAWAPADDTPVLLLLGGCLLALLVASLVAGGWLLVRTARREHLDALRKTDFVDNVSHELKTPLAGIRLSAELLAEGRIPEGPRRDKTLRSILSESDRLDRLVSKLLDFGRLERGRRQFARERVDLAKILEEIQHAAADDSSTCHSSFVTRHCERGVTALADPDAVRQILVNLLDNAAKYAAAGGPPDVSMRVAGDGAVEVVVADRGPGVPPGLEEKIFERFFRADDSMTRRANGSGLGLSIARGLARGMGGDLVCRARDGGGAEFLLILPGDA